MIVTVYKGAFDPNPLPHQISTFEELAPLIGDVHRVAVPNERDKAPVSTLAFNPCEFDGHGRSLPNVVRVHFGMVDIDKKPLEHVQKTLALFAGAPTFVYSTFSHGHKPGVSIRLLFPFTRPVLAAEWEYYIAGFQALTDKIIDTEKDPTRLFFVPVRRPERNDAFIIYSPGQRAFDVDACIRIGKEALRRPNAKTKPAANTDSETEPFTIASLKDVSATLKKSGKAASKEVATALDAVIAGHVYSRDGERDATLFKIAGAIARYFPTTPPETIAPFFVTSIEATNAFHKSGSTDDDLRKVIDKLQRTQAKVRATIEEEENEAEEARKSDIRAFFDRFGIDRDTPYTDDELDRIKQEIGADTEADLRHAWIVQNGRSYYVLTKFGYLPPISENALLASLRRDLAPAASAGVSIYGVNKDGEPIRRAEWELMDLYGTVARSARIDLTAPATYYDPSTQTIIEAPCPLRELKPLDPATDAAIILLIEDWLRALAGDDDKTFEKLSRWVAFVTRLESPCVALYLDGPPGCGKSLFAKGLSRLWTVAGATALSNAIARFNTAILRCPLIFADELLPDEMRGTSTARIREFQQNDTRMVERKNIPIAEMTGALRLILAANNKHMIETKEALTNSDVEGISERILYIQANTRAKIVLGSLGADVARLVTDDYIARYALYLRSKTWPVEGRFMIDTGTNNISKTLTVHAGERPLILHWLVSYLQNPLKHDQLNRYSVVIRDERLYVQTQALVDAWELYTTNAKAPVTARISTALKAISDETKVLRIGESTRRFYPIKTEILHAWVDEHGIASHEEIDSALTKPTKIATTKAVSRIEANPFQSGLAKP